MRLLAVNDQRRFFDDKLLLSKALDASPNLPVGHAAVLQACTMQVGCTNKLLVIQMQQSNWQWQQGHWQMQYRYYQMARLQQAEHCLLRSRRSLVSISFTTMLC